MHVDTLGADLVSVLSAFFHLRLIARWFFFFFKCSLILTEEVEPVVLAAGRMLWLE